MIIKESDPDKLSFTGDLCLLKEFIVSGYFIGDSHFWPWRLTKAGFPYPMVAVFRIN